MSPGAKDLIRVNAGDGSGPLSRLLRDRALTAVFQPIASLQDGSIYGHEALIRGLNGTPLHSPDALLAAAAREHLLVDFEIACLVTIVERWAALQNPGRLFVNMSATALLELVNSRSHRSLGDDVREMGILPRMLVIEVTEHERVADMPNLLEVVRKVHSAGIALALDDFGDGRSSLRLWSEAKPQIVKIDKYFTKDLSQHADKLQTLRALLQIAQTFATTLVVEGIENVDDLRILRDLRIPYGQGYFLGRPAPTVVASIEAAAEISLRDTRVAVFPEPTRQPNHGVHLGLNVIDAPSVSTATTNDEVAALLMRRADLHAVAVVSDGQRPVGVINRHGFMERYVRLYFKELHGKKSCVPFMNPEPRLVERTTSVGDMLGILTSQDQRYLTDGILITENGRYIGLGSGDQLVRAVTESRIEAARHANPLTYLPGNIPISQHMQRLLDGGGAFVACYADLNNFKPFNDHYGYWRGDEMIRLAARVCVENCDPERDFVGHVGGDDFFMLFQSGDWIERCERIVAQFNASALVLFDEPARRVRGIEAEDRQGVVRFFPCTTLSIGATPVAHGQFRLPEHVANEAAMAKHAAKRSSVSVLIRKPLPLTSVEESNRPSEWLDTHGAPLGISL